MSGDGHQYGDTIVADSANAIIGNVYHNYYHKSKEVCTEEEWRLLLTSFGYEAMNDRKHQIYQANSSTCQWIWNTVFARWLRAKKAKIFWISGKPGSGKSTLMKYLSQASEVKRNLPDRPDSWVIIDFFFDFRLMEKTGNTIEGLLRSLLFQIVRKFPKVGEELRADLYDDSDNSLECLERKFQTAINAAQHCFLILVDGLDEYSGKLGPLAKFLLRLRSLQRVKLCLASRPEAMIQHVFDGIPKIAMSDHNLAGIEEYINVAIKELQPRLDILQEPEIKETLLHKSDGVFLWVHLVLAEVIEVCAEGAMLIELKEKLEMLPTELELLYDRILEKVPPSRKTETATIFTLIDTATAHLTLFLLQNTMYFLAHEMHIPSLPKDLIDLELFKRRLHGTMRGLVDVVQGTDERFTDSKAKFPTVRLIHRTLRSYAKNSAWFQNNLPLTLQQIGTPWIWTHVCSKAVLEAGRYTHKSTRSESLCSYQTETNYQNFAQHVLGLSDHKLVVHWIALLFHSIAYTAMHAESAIKSGSRAMQAFTGAALQCPISYIHFALIDDHWSRGCRPVGGSMNCEIADLVLAAAHTAIHYLRDKSSRIAALSDDQRRELVGVLIFTSTARQYCRGHCPEIVLDVVKEVVDSILSYDRRLSAFHLGAYLWLGYNKIPQFLSQSSRRDEYRHSELPVVPSWFITRNLFTREPALFIWACEYKVFDGLDFRDQLQVLASFDLDINCKSSMGYNIVHYIITRHVVGHTFLEKVNDCDCCPTDGDDISEAVVKLYVVEEFGADFTTQFEHRTPLQAFRHGVDLIRKAPELQQDIPEARFTHFEFMLQHKEETGHLPQPMLGSSRWREEHFVALLKRNCNICAGKMGEAGIQESSLGSVIDNAPRLSRPSPSRIPRPKRSKKQSQPSASNNRSALLPACQIRTTASSSSSTRSKTNS